MNSFAIFAVFLFFVFSSCGMELSPDNKVFDKNFVLQQEKIKSILLEAISDNISREKNTQKIAENFITLRCQNKQFAISMDELFRASEQLISTDILAVLEQHPLYQCFENLEHKTSLRATVKSGPDIQDITAILLKKDELDISKANSSETISMNIFNNAETFLRCLDIFTRSYQKHKNKTVISNLSYDVIHVPLKNFCQKYIAENHAISSADPLLFNKIVNLLSVFEVNNNIDFIYFTLNLEVQEYDPSAVRPSFKPIAFQANIDIARISNEISLGQLDLKKQIQNLNGSQLAMPYIKDADGYEQFKFLASLLPRENIYLVDIGGGQGETNAIIHELQKNGTKIHLLNIEPHKPFAESYIKAHKSIGVHNVASIEKTAQQVTALDVKNFFKQKADIVFASHAFYFILDDLHKATQAYINGDLVNINDHPLTKYFDMLQENGSLIVTLQSGAGVRLFRNALLGNDGLDIDNNTKNKTASLLRSFGNMASFMRYLDFFAQLYKQQCGKKIISKLHYSVANVPLGDINLQKNYATNGYEFSNNNADNDIAINMMDFYGNWKELQSLATLTFEEARKMDSIQLSKLGITTLNAETLAAKHRDVIKTQETFLHILRVFAPGLKNMLHPNIILEIRLSSEHENI